MDYMADLHSRARIGQSAAELAAAYPTLRLVSGLYAHPATGEVVDHAWCVTAKGTIIDTNHRQFVASRALVIADPRSRTAGRYLAATQPSELPARACARVRARETA